MGIPSYFVYLVKNHNSIIKKYDSKICRIHNLYLDCNSIIYDAVKEIPFNNSTINYTIDSINTNYENKIIDWVNKKIIYYVNLIKPLENVMIAFDGVAPIAKLEQQRSRRYKSWYVKNYIELNGTEEEKNKIFWDTTAITPGTSFMKNLCSRVELFFNQKQYSSILDKTLKNLKFDVSTSNIEGEGEHKIFEKIRNNLDLHKDKTTIIYGLDADLIMLTLLHSIDLDNLYLFRETPYFINLLDSSLIPNEHYIIDIKYLGEIITEKMLENKIKNNEIQIQNVNNYYEKCINDYVFICFFLGNDFMPHFPALNIRTNGIDILLNIYNTELLKEDKLVDKDKIIWKNLRKIVKVLSDNEENYCIGEGIKRNKIEKKITSNLNRFKTSEEKLMALPQYDRTIEKYINIGYIGWEQRYYKELFRIDINDIREKQICLNYLQGLEWNIKYYKFGCPDWRWNYHYSYPPLLKDLFKYIPYFDSELVPNKVKNPVSPLLQLCYVLPRNSLTLLPKEIFTKLIINFEDKYKLDNKILYVFCKYLWEGHVLLPSLDIDKLEALVNS